MSSATEHSTNSRAMGDNLFGAKHFKKARYDNLPLQTVPESYRSSGPSSRLSAKRALPTLGDTQCAKVIGVHKLPVKVLRKGKTSSKFQHNAELKRKNIMDALTYIRDKTEKNRKKGIFKTTCSRALFAESFQMAGVYWFGRSQVDDFYAHCATEQCQRLGKPQWAGEDDALDIDEFASQFYKILGEEEYFDEGVCSICYEKFDPTTLLCVHNHKQIDFNAMREDKKLWDNVDKKINALDQKFSAMAGGAPNQSPPSAPPVDVDNVVAPAVAPSQMTPPPKKLGTEESKPQPKATHVDQDQVNTAPPLRPVTASPMHGRPLVQQPARPVTVSPQPVHDNSDSDNVKTFHARHHIICFFND